jgi:hypothetical protein
LRSKSKYAPDEKKVEKSDTVDTLATDTTTDTVKKEPTEVV